MITSLDAITSHSHKPSDYPYSTEHRPTVRACDRFSPSLLHTRRRENLKSHTLKLIDYDIYVKRSERETDYSASI
jgi:hypothetical protein